jgi:hypothetical protein
MLSCSGIKNLEINASFQDDMTQLPWELQEKIFGHIIESLWFVELNRDVRIWVDANAIRSNFDASYEEALELATAFPKAAFEVFAIVDERAQHDAGYIFWTSVIDNTVLESWLAGVPAHKVVLSYGHL